MSKNSNTAVSESKALRNLLGVSGVKIKATKVFSKEMPFDHEGTTARSWAMITPDNKIIRVNAYNGNLGRNFDLNAEGIAHPLPDEKTLAKKLKQYSEVSGKDLPEFVEIVSA